MAAKRWELLERLADLKIDYYTLHKKSANPTESSEERLVAKRMADNLGVKMFQLETENKHILKPTS